MTNAQKLILISSRTISTIVFLTGFIIGLNALGFPVVPFLKYNPFLHLSPSVILGYAFFFVLMMFGVFFWILPDILRKKKIIGTHPIL